MAWGSAEEQKLEHEAGNPNAKDWHDEATKIIKETMTEYWEQMKPLTTSKPPANSPNKHSKCPLKSDFNCLLWECLLQATVQTDNGGWKPELQRYLTDIPKDISKEMDIVAWWAACSDDYPTLSHIAMDICAILATSVPCGQLFSTGAEIATNHHSCLGANRFEQLQILKHAW
ncbi:hypothetical protein SCLCIDRAFT_118381 [Scleroderma citrinum Foug A]|uniref:HAT C-terminal dimerisation domain-containing protein n=1 Tax=Scleroderma citrinum Foug A TaxID=1036808 RepID=A0A0C3E3I2_9AGAM|nr:hypothetical protein SCLCIDRAFT_118381 [Scleroderma citrinum Foug A]